MKKYITGIFAVVIALSLTLGLSSFKKDHAAKHHPNTDYYYQFTGTHGQESTMSKWVQLASVDDYNDLPCSNGSTNSCKIINNTNSGLNPTSVPLDINGFPQQGTVNTAVVLKGQ
jgi:hypothetical protein